MSTHSPGPWEPMPRLLFDMLTIVDSEGHHVAHVTRGRSDHANWRLIAAAPEMLEALKDVSELLSEHKAIQESSGGRGKLCPIELDRWETVKEVIQRATGDRNDG